ncbi:unnamed protein product, partial [Didymodactylos carnosus]
MAQLGDLINKQYTCKDIHIILSTKLEELRQKSPEHFSKPIHALAAVDDSIERQLEQLLQQERKDHIGKRIALIPYHLENSHWVGILIEFTENERIKRAEYIDSVNGSNITPEKLQSHFAQVYPDDVLQVKHLQKEDDHLHSAALTIENLLVAANIKHPTVIERSKKEESISSPTTHIPKEGNEYERRELEQKLHLFNSDWSKEVPRDVRMLSGKIRRAVDQTNVYEEQEKTEDVEEEVKYVSSSSLPDDKSKVHELKKKLDNGLVKIHLQNVDELPGKIQDSEELIHELQKQGKKKEVQNEITFLHQLQELQKLWEEICILTSVEFMPDKAESLIQPVSTKPSDDADIIPFNLKHKKRLYLETLSADLAAMPPCARKTTMTLIAHFEQRLLGDCAFSQKKDFLILSLRTLHDEINREKLLSEKTKAILRDLETYKTSDNFSFIVRYLEELLKNIRSLNVPEIQRFVAKAKEAAELIAEKEIILLVGETGSGKSTIIQFLAGATMEETRVEIAAGRYLEHITAVGQVKNPELNSIISSPLNKSETRYIAPVTVQLKDVLGAHENGVITLCDAPGFDDTAGPEVDIANSIGVIEALKGTKSVKILALSSFKSLGDRGQGIQKLAHILINMVDKIADRLDAIFYIFTKYPKKTDINASLLDIYKCKIDKDYTSQSDSPFAMVLSDMIDKTEGGACMIDPVLDKPKLLIKKLKSVNGIQHPGEVFRFSMGKGTRDSIANHVQNDKYSIECAMKLKDHNLVLYYLNDLKILKDLIKQSFVGDAYHNSISFITENVSEDCKKIIGEFNRALTSQDRLNKDDIRDYKASVECIQHIQMLNEHLEPSTIAPAMSMLENINSILQHRSLALVNEELH